MIYRVLMPEGLGFQNIYYFSSERDAENFMVNWGKAGTNEDRVEMDWWRVGASNIWVGVAVS